MGVGKGGASGPKGSAVRAEASRAAFEFDPSGDYGAVAGLKPVLDKYHWPAELQVAMHEAEKVVFETSMKQVAWGLQELCSRSKASDPVKGKKARGGIYALFKQALEPAANIDHIDAALLGKSIRLLSMDHAKPPELKGASEAVQLELKAVVETQQEGPEPKKTAVAAEKSGAGAAKPQGRGKRAQQHAAGNKAQDEGKEASEVALFEVSPSLSSLLVRCSTMPTQMTLGTHSFVQ